MLKIKNKNSNLLGETWNGEWKYFSNSETIISRNKINSKNQQEVILLGHFKCRFFKQYIEDGTGKRFSVTVN